MSTLSYLPYLIYLILSILSYHVVTTGAAEVVLGRCDHIIGEDGAAVGLTAKTYDRLVEEVSTQLFTRFSDFTVFELKPESLHIS